MALAESIFTALSTTSGVTAILGAGTACQAYPDTAPAGTAAPYVVFNHVAAVPGATHGEATAEHDLVQFACFASTHLAARNLCSAVIAALDGVTLSGVGNPTLQDRRADYDTAVDLHRCDADFLI